MNDIFTTSVFRFPYTDFQFPGQSTDEEILYVTREAPIVLTIKRLGVIGVALLMIFGGLFLSSLPPEISPAIIASAQMLFIIFGVIFGVIGWWWVSVLWKKSLFILTNRRLTKFIYVTPWNRYNLSVTLDKIENTGAYNRGNFEAFFKVGTLTARSSAGNREEKYFFVTRIKAAEDLANYINKLLFIFHHNPQQLVKFRPFLPHLKGERRKMFMQSYPEYWS
ncbi:hypothetical protein BH11PAT1_BH11PAT1_7050 [soil metagenome]